MLVFVYGTLRKTGRFNHLLKNAQFIDTDSINAQMFFYPYPAIYPYIFLNHNSTIIGEIYKIDDTILSTLDRLEGYNPKYTSHYQRTLITTHKNHQVFVYSRNTHPCNNIIPIESGDYIQFQNNLNQTDPLYQQAHEMIKERLKQQQKYEKSRS